MNPTPATPNPSPSTPTATIPPSLHTLTLPHPHQHVRSLLVGLLLLGALGVQSATEFRSRRATFMRQKMAYNQALLEGLTLGKLDEVSKNAIRLREMSSKDMWFLVSDGKRTWQSASPEFKAATIQFAKDVDGVFLAATDKDLKKATEAYKRVIDSCVQCHTQFRAEQLRPH